MLGRTSQSPIIYEVLDCACGLTSPRATWWPKRKASRASSAASVSACGRFCDKFRP